MAELASRTSGSSSAGEKCVTRMMIVVGESKRVSFRKPRWDGADKCVMGYKDVIHNFKCSDRILETTSIFLIMKNELHSRNTYSKDVNCTKKLILLHRPQMLQVSKRPVPVAENPLSS